MLRPKTTSEPVKRITSMGDALVSIQQRVKDLAPEFEVDLFFYDDIIEIHDMRIPNGIRRHKLYTRPEIQDDVHKIPGDLEQRIEKIRAR